MQGVSDTSSGYHEDYDTSGDELDNPSQKVPNVIMEQSSNTRFALELDRSNYP